MPGNQMKALQFSIKMLQLLFLIIILDSSRLCFEKAQEMSGKNWILLVAGSKGWENYKHQVCVCLFVIAFKTNCS